MDRWECVRKRETLAHICVKYLNNNNDNNPQFLILGRSFVLTLEGMYKRVVVLEYVDYEDKLPNRINKEKELKTCLWEPIQEWRS